LLVDWRGDAFPKEPNKRRPCVVVEDDGLFGAVYPNVIVVPLTEDADLAIPDLAVEIPPSAENGCTKLCWAISSSVTASSKRRVKGTGSFVTVEQLGRIRRQIMLAVGVER